MKVLMPLKTDLKIERKSVADSDQILTFYGRPIETLDRELLLYAVYKLMNENKQLKEKLYATELNYFSRI